MNNFELISYKQTPNDQYTDAYAKIRIDRKYVVTYALKKMKDGGKFWAPASFSVQEDAGGAKKFIQGFYMDSRAEEESLLDFIKESVQRYVAIKPAMEASVHAYNQQPEAASGGRAEDGQLPF